MADQNQVRMILGGEYWWQPVTYDYLDYLRAVRPDLIHVGVLGPELAGGLASGEKAITPLFPEQAESMSQYLAWWRGFLEQARDLDIRTQATFSLVSLWGNHETGTGYFQYINEMWEESVLGPRPETAPVDYLEIDAEGQPLRHGNGPTYMYRGCVNHPAWRATLKAMVRAGVETGFDGFMVQFPHWRGTCACDYCQEAYRAFLRERHDDQTLARRFDIHDLDQHRFEVTGPRPGLPTPIDMEARAFTAHAVKNCFDEVFIDYGRSLKPDLLVSQWTHFRQFLTEDTRNTEFSALIDERALLPLNQWARGEDYVWYSSPVYTGNLAEGIRGEAIMDTLFLRAMGGGKPFLVLKYDYFRWRNAAAEALAGGGIVFGAWQGGWSGGADRHDPHLLPVFDFIRRHDLYNQHRPSAADVGLLFSRQAIFAGNAGFLDRFRALGHALGRRQIVYDILIDQRLPEQDLSEYALIILTAPDFLNAAIRESLERYVAGGGVVTVWPSEDRPVANTADLPPWPVMSPDGREPEALSSEVRRLANRPLSQFDAPWTVHVTADRQTDPDHYYLHFINYNRDESKRGWELPIAAPPINVTLRSPYLDRIESIRFLDFERDDERTVTFERTGDALKFTLPEFSAYGLAVMPLRPPSNPTKEP